MKLKDLLASMTKYDSPSLPLSLSPQCNVDSNKTKNSIRLQTQQTRTYLGYGRKRYAAIYGTIQRYGIATYLLETDTVEMNVLLGHRWHLCVRAVSSGENFLVTRYFRAGYPKIGRPVWVATECLTVVSLSPGCPGRISVDTWLVSSLKILVCLKQGLSYSSVWPDLASLCLKCWD